MRVIERRQDLRLALETRDPIGLQREELRKDLQRDVAIEVRVTRAIDLAHPARAQRHGDLVDTEADAGS